MSKSVELVGILSRCNNVLRDREDQIFYLTNELERSAATQVFELAQYGRRSGNVYISGGSDSYPYAKETVSALGRRLDAEGLELRTDSPRVKHDSDSWSATFRVVIPESQESQEY